MEESYSENGTYCVLCTPSTAGFEPEMYSGIYGPRSVFSVCWPSFIETNSFRILQHTVCCTSKQQLERRANDEEEQIKAVR